MNQQTTPSIISAVQERLTRKQELEAQLTLLQTEIKGEALGTIKAIIKEANVSLADVLKIYRVKTTMMKKAVKNKASVKYADPVNPANTWTKHGKKPRWLQTYIESGRELSEFLVK